MISQVNPRKNCRLCSAHGVSISSISHSCAYNDCECQKCKLIRKRRAIVAEQTRIRRTQKKVLHPCVSPSSSSSSDSPHIANRAYYCQRCMNHGTTIPKKSHDCRFACCLCSKCQLWTTRARVDEQLRKSEEPSTLQGIPPILPSTSTPAVEALLPSSSSTIAAILTSPSCSLPIPPSNPFVARVPFDPSTPEVHPSLLPPGYLDSCLATNAYEIVDQSPIIVQIPSFPFM